MDSDYFQSDSEEEQEQDFLPAGIGSDVEDHAISSSDDDERGGTPKLTSDQIPDFDSAEQGLGALIDQHDMEAAGPSEMTSSFLSMPENLRQEDLHIKKPPVVKETKGKGKKRTKRKVVKDGGKDGEPKKKKKKKSSKKEGGKKKEKQPSKDAAERSKRRNIKTFLRQDELEAETLNAQREEEERKKRLEEQRALNTELATLSELLSDVPSQPQPPPLQPPPSPSQPTQSSRAAPMPHQSTLPPPTTTSTFPPTSFPPLAPIPRMPLPVPVLTPAIQSQMMKSFPPSQFRPFPSLQHHVPPMMQGLSLPKPPPRMEDGFIVLDDSSGDDEPQGLRASGQEDDVIQISSGDEDVTVVSDGSGKEEEAMDDEEGQIQDEESSGMHTNDACNVPDAYGRVLVNVNHPPDEPDIFLAEHLSKTVKPHQIGGIRFLYDNLVESLNRHSQSMGFGCILAHSMGLGKTLQLISFTDIYMRYTNSRTVLIIVPINTLQNWMAEFEMWLPKKTRQEYERAKAMKEANRAESSEDNDVGEGDSNGQHSNGNDQVGAGGDQRLLRTFPIFVLNDMHKTTDSRLSVIDEWYTDGGVLLMGYEMYRLLCSRKPARARKKPASSRRKAQVIDLEEEDRKEGMIMDIRRALVKPGPDLVICDEGHRIKNSLAGISQALKNIRTRRRVVLTGYPLQNNLQEYWCMVDFVRPNFLGTKHEFANLFERPISNGQCMDSTPNDVRLMQHRAHVLHMLLQGFVQRRGFKVLRTALPPKEEHVLLVRLTTFQRGLYIRFMQRFTEAGAAGWCNTNPLKAFSVACKIWNHPDVLCEVLQTRETLDSDADLDLPEFNPKSNRGRKKGSKDKDANGSGGGEDSGKSSPSSEVLAAAGCSKSTPPSIPDSYQDKVSEILSFEWARDLMRNYQQNKISNSSKMVLLFKIIEESMRMGDKILVFSQSLMTLSVIEKFLAFTPVPQPDKAPPDMPTQWTRNVSYFRLDGSTPVSEREKMINEFNRPNNNKMWLFLLSTRAGSLGINLIGANRVVILDASWNPCHDAQAVCRVYRYGQTKRCHIYRMVTDNTLEKKIYDRQISKKGMSDRVVDELNPEMNLTKKEVESLLEFDESDMPYEDFSHMADKFNDCILKMICAQYSNTISKVPFTTESLLCDRRDRRLTRAEKRQAESNYEAEKKLSLSYSRPSYAAYYGQGGGPSKPRINIDANAAHASSLPSSFMSRYTANRPVANVRPIQSTPVPKTPMNNMQQRLLELRNAGVTVQKIVATTDIILPGTNTPTNSNPLIRAGEQVTFIKTQKGVYLRTTDGRILAVRGAQQSSGSRAQESSASAGLNLGQDLASTFTSPPLSSGTFTTPSGVGGGPSSGANQMRHQLADLLKEKTPHGTDPISLSSDSDADSDFFDPFKSPHKMSRSISQVVQDLNKQDGSSSTPGSPFPGVITTKPATCTVSPGVQSVPLASTLPLGPFGQSRQSSATSSQGPEDNPTSASNLSPATSESVLSPATSQALDQMMGLPTSNPTTPSPLNSTPPPPSSSAAAASTAITSANQTPSNLQSTNTSTQQPMQPQPAASNYGMPFFPGMVPMPSTGNSQQQQQQPPIVINYQLPMPPGTMMQPGFMPFGFPPMMYNPGAAAAAAAVGQQAQGQQGQSQPQGMQQMQGQGGQFQTPGGMFQTPAGQMGQGQGQSQMGQGQGGQSQSPGMQNLGQSSQDIGTVPASVVEGSSQSGSIAGSDVMNQKMTETQQGSQMNTANV